MTYGCDDFLLATLRGGEPRADELRHRAICADCAVLAAALPDVARTLRVAEDVPPPPDLAGRVLAAASPLLEANARAHRAHQAAPRLDGRRLATALLPAVLLFPLLVLADLVLLRTLHDALATLLPQGLTTYLVASYATLLLALVCLTFGAIPLLVQRQGVVPWKEGHV